MTRRLRLTSKVNVAKDTLCDTLLITVMLVLVPLSYPLHLEISHFASVAPFSTTLLTTRI
jgi:hypothetical protein